MRLWGKNLTYTFGNGTEQAYDHCMTFHLSLVVTSLVFCLLSLFKIKFLRTGHASYSVLYSV